jgi:hypothetical protein
MGSQPAGHVGVGGLAEVQSSGTEVEFDAVAWRLEADVAADADGLAAAEFADDVGEFGGWVEFSVEGAEPAGFFGGGQPARRPVLGGRCGVRLVDPRAG